MALPSSGPISMSQIRTEFGGSAPDSLSEYYKNGTYVKSTDTAPNVASYTGPISLMQFLGAAKNLGPQFISSSYGYNTLWGAWPSGVLANDIIIFQASNAPASITNWTEFTSGGMNTGLRIFWHRCGGGETGSTWTAVGTNCLYWGMSLWRGCYTSGSPIDGTIGSLSTSTFQTTVPAASSTHNQDTICCAYYTYGYSGSSDYVDYGSPGVGFTTGLPRTGNIDLYTLDDYNTEDGTWSGFSLGIAYGPQANAGSTGTASFGVGTSIWTGDFMQFALRNALT